MTTTPHGSGARGVATLAAGGAVLGLVLALSRTGVDGCASAAHRLGACAPEALVAAKPLVSAGVVGFLLGALIGVAVVLVWREARAAVTSVGWRPGAPPRTVARGRANLGGATFTPRARH